MSRKCCVPACGASKVTHPHLSFHQLPKDQETKEKWMCWLRTQHVNHIVVSVLVCSDHFKSADRPLNHIQEENLVQSNDIQIQGEILVQSNHIQDEILVESNHLQDEILVQSNDIQDEILLQSNDIQDVSLVQSNDIQAEIIVQSNHTQIQGEVFGESNHIQDEIFVQSNDIVVLGALAVPSQDTLNNISIGNVSVSDYSLLQARFVTSLDRSEKAKFEDAVHLYATKNEVQKHNKVKLANLRDKNNAPVSVVKIVAKHNCKAAEEATTDEAEGLQSHLYAAQGAKLMLCTNLWTRCGLVNGSVGEVVDILYHPDSNPQSTMLAVLICKFKTYIGPCLNEAEQTIPIVPVTRTWHNATGID
ncbi:hypothetical protein FOCC_FOCC000821 [Frankliniella occidentalis]|nr:hypothetical protein FOCC_FOCC000821 [Frankliniella occidentalis]